MKLEKITLRNFRCYQERIEFLVDDLTCIIGKNDIGKSTILESLDAFFNENIEAGDLSTDHSNNVIEIGCIFSGIPDSIVLDSSIPTSPASEGILNEDGKLEVIKMFTIGSTVGKAIYLNCYHPNAPELQNLLSLKNASLKLKAEELGIDLSRINRTKNPPLREALRNHYSQERQIIQLKVDGNLNTEDNLKTVWSSLKNTLPIYTLFKVDKSLDDKDKDVQDPMKAAVEETLAIPEIKELLDQIEEKVKEKSTEVADRIIEKLKDIDHSLAERLISDFKKAPTWKNVFDLTLLNEHNIPLNKRGSGVRRLVLLSFFQAQAEKRKNEKNAPSIIYAIEEPETSQHPNNQLLLIQSLIDLAQRENTQVLFTSHSANLVREIPLTSLRFISETASGVLVEYGVDINTGEKDENTINKIISTLGILPNPADKVKVLVYVEGSHDVNGLKGYSSILNLNDSRILDLSSDQIAWVITGGSSLKHYLENRYLEGLGKPEVHIYDSDVRDYVHVVNKINGEGNPIKKAFNTSKLELENYLHHEAINEAYAEQGNPTTLVSIQDDDDVPLIVAENLYVTSGNDWSILNTEKQKEKASGKKGFLNTKAIEKMSVDRIKDRAGYDELKLWIDTISSFL